MEENYIQKSFYEDLNHINPLILKFYFIFVTHLNKLHKI